MKRIRNTLAGWLRRLAAKLSVDEPVVVDLESAGDDGFTVRWSVDGTLIAPRIEAIDGSGNKARVVFENLGDEVMGNDYFVVRSGP